MFWVMLLAFVHSFTIAFGEIIPNMSSFESCLVTLARSFLGDVNFLPIYQVSPSFGAFLILAFYVVIMLVGLNVFFAILAYAISENKANIDDLKKDVRHLALNDAVENVKNWSRQRWQKTLLLMPKAFRLYKKKIEPAKAEIADKSPTSKRKSRKSVAGEIEGSESGVSTSTASAGKLRQLDITEFSTEEISIATDKMAGRILSKIEGLGHEVHAETIRVKEGLKEMLHVAKVLSSRAEQIGMEQGVYLKKVAARY